MTVIYNRFGQAARPCPGCGEGMIMKVLSKPPVRAYWVCADCDYMTLAESERDERTEMLRRSEPSDKGEGRTGDDVLCVLPEVS